MKKESVSMNSSNNSSGVTSVVFGILSIVFASLIGIILAIISIGFAIKQNKSSPNKWSKAAMILSIIGLILSILIIALDAWLRKNPQILNQVLTQYGSVPQ
ncbi:MAG: hypothetical protein Q7S74_00060 [Nanoarchaeota archaeon]|nr:hypothetical protein [Nanoarchaeota archaeon]